MSNWHALRRLVATLLTWKRRKPIDIEALRQAEQCIIKMIQKKYLTSEVKQLEDQPQADKRERKLKRSVQFLSLILFFILMV